MPRGFLVKRTKCPGAISYRNRGSSEEELEKIENGHCHYDNNSQQEVVVTKFGSPDSGYSASPVNLIIRESADTENNNCPNKEYVSFSPSSSPLTVTTNSTSSYPSPFYYSTFDKLSVSTNSPNNLNLNNCAQNNNLNIQQVNDNKSSSSPLSSQNSPNKRRGNVDNDNNKSKIPKKPKAARKINFDEDKSSPVSGCIIKDLSDTEEEGKVVYGDIDSTYNFVEVTPEARAELEKIENKIGDYICQLCKEFYTDAFQLAQHRCSRIVHVEYRCPECDKVFSCPANLASHRRWHKPRPVVNNKTSGQPRILPANPANLTNLNEDNAQFHQNSQNFQNSNILSLTVGDLRSSPSNDDGQYECETCGKKFRRQAYLRKHVLNHANDQQSNCKFCNKTFPNDAMRTKHELLHLNNNNKEFSCSLCKLILPNKISLEKHFRTHTSDVFTCKYCSSTFYSSPGLTRHINKCHPSENRQVILLQFPQSVSRPN